MLALTLSLILIGSPQAPEWVLEPERRVGALDGASSLSVVGGLEVDSLGRIFVKQSQEKTIKVFDHEGKWLSNIGREGGGPGEFRQIHSLSLGPDGLYVLDAAARRLTRFSLEGEYEESWGVPMIDLDHPLVPMAPLTALADGRLLMQPDFRRLPGAGEIRLPLISLSQDFSRSSVLGWIDVSDRSRRTTAGILTASVPQPVTSQTLWAVAPGGAALFLVHQTPTAPGRANHFEVLKLNVGGDTIFQRHYRYPAVAIPPGAVESYRRDLLEKNLRGRPQ